MLGLDMFRETASDAFVVAARSWACGKPRSGFPSSARAERHVHTHSRGAVDIRRVGTTSLGGHGWSVAVSAGRDGGCLVGGGTEVELGLHLQVQEIAEQNWLLAILASTAKTHHAAKVVAL